jgi:hypothetical protein
MIAHVIATLRIAMGTVGLFFGYYELFGKNTDDRICRVDVLFCSQDHGSSLDHPVLSKAKNHFTCV